MKTQPKDCELTQTEKGLSVHSTETNDYLWEGCISGQGTKGLVHSELEHWKLVHNGPVNWFTTD
eukprot:725683-Alexandrium_andersonii.AAC.1